MRTLIASCSAIAVAAGCASTRPVPPARAEGAPRDRWTIAVPSTLRALLEVQALVRARGERFDVQVIEFDGAADAASARLAALRAQLASFKIPRAFVRVEALPRTALGKVQKHLLPGIAP